MAMFGGLILCNMVFAASIPVTSVTKDAGGVTFAMTPGSMRIDVCTESILRVRYGAQSPIPNDANMDFLVEKKWTNVAFTENETESEVVIATSKVQVKVNKSTGVVAFFDAGGKVLLQEVAAGGKKITSSTVNGESTNTCEQIFDSPEDEGIYGLGSMHGGYINMHGVPEYLYQLNTHIAIPMILSSKGYGLLWANASRTYFNLPEQKINLSGGKGSFTTTTAGDYVFLSIDNQLQGNYSLTVDGTVVATLDNTWHSGSLPGKISLSANKTVEVSVVGGTPTLYGGPLQNQTKFTSRAGQTIDYYFFYGPSGDEVIAGFRVATGAASLLPKGTYGFIQCRERYSSQKQIVDTANQFRNRKIPVDVIVQDWNYWGNNGWGSMMFDQGPYPNPRQMIDDLHKLHFSYMISVWSNPEGTIGSSLSSKGQKIPGTSFFDAFNPAARETYWATMKTNLLDIGTDAFWQDADEPEGVNLEERKVNFGSGQVGGKTYANAYGLHVCKTVYEGWRSTNSTKRVCLKSRSAFPGAQKYGSFCWNGDINGNWNWYQRSIVAGLNFSMAGMPYWTTDIGGFFRPGGGQYNDAGFRELFTRWIQYGAFCPMFRIHGYQTETEVWRFGNQVLNTFMIYDNLRYRLLPYIYSMAGNGNLNGGTMMKGLVMDYRNDPKVLNINDQFMFGPSLLVNPITKAGATSRDVYLPEGTWYNFWNGEKVEGGKTISASAPIDTIPLFVKAGSIIPMGPYLQYSSEKKADTIELRVYPGANGSFTLYEDEGDSYNYEKGKYSLIPISYVDNQKKVVMGKRTGGFDGMDQQKVFKVVYVGNNHGTGVGITTTIDTQFVYNGDGVTIVNLRPVSINAIAPKTFTKKVSGNVVTLPSSYARELKSIAIYDCSGKLLRNVDSKRNTFDLRKDFGLPSGMYVVKACVVKGLKTK
jgi:alpha-D-xyloside xylohydrolase